jgi:hypothetical protein
MENARSHLEIFRDISAENVLTGFHILLSFTNTFLFFLQPSGGLLLNHKEIEAAAIMMRIFLAGLAFNFDADFHELKDITKRALLEIDVGASR